MIISDCIVFFLIMTFDPSGIHFLWIQNRPGSIFYGSPYSVL